MKIINLKYLVFSVFMLGAFSVLAQEEELQPETKLPEPPILEESLAEQKTLTETAPLSNQEQKLSESIESNNKITEPSKEVEQQGGEEKKSLEKKVISNLAEEVFSPKKEVEPTANINSEVKEEIQNNAQPLSEANSNEVEKKITENNPDSKPINAQTENQTTQKIENPEKIIPEANNENPLKEDRLVDENNNSSSSSGGEKEVVQSSVSEAAKNNEGSNLAEKITELKTEKKPENADIVPAGFGNYTKISIPESMEKQYGKTVDVSMSQVSNNKHTTSDNIFYQPIDDISELGEVRSIEVNDFNVLEYIAAETENKRRLKIKEDIKIEKGDFKNPFTEEASPDIKNLAKQPNNLPNEKNPHEAKKITPTETNFYLKNNGLKLEVKSPENNLTQYYRNAYESLKAGLYESAISYYRAVLKIKPKDTRARFGLATSYHKAGQLDNAKEEYFKIIEQGDNTKALNNYLILVTQENPENAIEKLEELANKNSEIAAIPAQIGSLYYRKQNFSKAAEYYLQAVNKDAANTNYRYNLAIILEKLQQNEMAARLYKSLLDDSAKGLSIPENPITLRERYFSLLSKN